MSQEQDKAFFRNFSIVLIVLAVLMATFMTLGILFGGEDESSGDATAEAMKNTAPVAKIQIQDNGSEAQATEDTTKMAVAEESTAMGENTETATTGNDNAGKATYDSLCVACHGSGIPGIPQFGDTAAWAPRIEKGKDTLYTHALNGFTGNAGLPMPARGGNSDLSDDAVKAAVDYMVANSQ